MNVDLFFDHYFNFLSTKTEIYKNEFNLINLDRSEVFKQITGTWLGIWLNRIEIYVIWRTHQIPATRLAMWLNDFEFDVIWTASQLLLKLHSHISVLWPFSKISVISEFLFLGVGLTTKTWKSHEIFLFGSTKLKWMSTCFLITILTFWVLKLKYTKTNSI